MSEIIIHGDVEEILQLGLTAGMQMLGDPVPVHITVPSSRPKEFLRVGLVGGQRRNLVTDNPTIVLEAWAVRAGRALELANEARGLMHWFTEINGYAIYDVTEFAAPGNLPDTSGAARYTATYSIGVRAIRTLQIG